LTQASTHNTSGSRLWAEHSPEELAVRAQGGDEAGIAAFSELVERFSGRLHSFLLRRLPPADAEDLTQEAFIRAWQRIGTYNPRYRFSTWLFTIATRLAISHGRVDRRGREREFDSAGNSSQAGIDSTRRDSRRDPGASASQREERLRIWETVAEILGDEQHTAIWLRYVEEMSIAEIARVMGRTPVGVRVMLFRARNLLAQRMERTEDGVRAVEKPGAGSADAKGPESTATLEPKVKTRLKGASCAGGAA
jgi:RNA polymerase sigma-70 factor, ECF subfamily